MNLFLENSFLQFSLAPAHAAWSLNGFEKESPILEGLQLSAAYRLGRRRFTALDVWEGVEVSAPETVASPHGPLRQITLRSGLDLNGMAFTVSFAMPDRQPLFLWKLAVANQGSQPVNLERLELLRSGALAEAPRATSGKPTMKSMAGSRIIFHTPVRPRSRSSSLAFFANGWQSWSYTGRYTAGDRYRRTRLGPFRAPTEAGPGVRRPATGRFYSDQFGVLGDPTRRTAILCGFLSQRQQFGLLEAWLPAAGPGLSLWAEGDDARLDPGQQTGTDWACIQFLQIDDPDPLVAYLDAVARENGLELPDGQEGAPSNRYRNRQRTVAAADIPTGWCSWYQYSSNSYIGALAEADIQQNLAALAELRGRLPLSVVQIDDGFERKVGDWFEFSPSFPQGLTSLATEIRAAGFTSGLWLAPFILQPDSRLATEHPDWLLRGRNGRPVNAGRLWNRFAAALDLTQPDALDWAADVVRTAVQDWGYAYLKLDFLYAAALPGRRHDPTRTRAQVLRSGLETLRRAAGPQAFLLGCGCPLGPAIGLIDSMRIGTDTARHWKPFVKGVSTLLKSEPNLPSARNSLNNALTRAFLHRRWWVNDPDCLLTRPPASPNLKWFSPAGLSTAAEQRPDKGKRSLAAQLPTSALSLAEVQTAATVIALTGGSLLISDDLAALPEERLRLVETLLPPIGKAPRVLDWFDSAPPRRLRLDLEGPAGTWQLLALFNWEDQPRFLTLRVDEFDLDPQAAYIARTFWKGALYPVGEGFLPTRRLAPHSSLLVALRKAMPGEPQYLGSDLHISQGLEVTHWEAKPNRLELHLARPGPAQGQVDLSLPRPPASASLDGQPVAWKAVAAGFYRIPVSFHRQARLVIRYAEDSRPD